MAVRKSQGIEKMGLARRVEHSERVDMAPTFMATTMRVCIAFSTIPHAIRLRR